MYLGFMKMGLSLMLGFMVLIAVAALTNLGVLAIFPIALYIYSFFHANNLGALSDAEFYSIKDQYLFGMEGLDSIEKMRIGISQKHRKIAAVVMIAIGVIMLWNMTFDLFVDIYGWNNYYVKQINHFMNYRMPRAVIAVAIIWIGISLIRGKKVEYVEDDRDAVKGQDVSGEQYTANGQNVSDARVSGNGQSGSDGQNITNNEQETSSRQTVSVEQNTSDDQENQ